MALRPVVPGADAEALEQREIGHMLDHIGLAGAARVRTRDWDSAQERTAEMQAVMAAIRATSPHALLGHSDPYFSQSWELLWARAYAKYIAWRSGSSWWLNGQLNKVLTGSDPHVLIRVAV